MSFEGEVLRELAQEWKGATDAQKQARERLIPAVRAAWANGEGLSMREIARQMDVSLGTVQKLLSANQEGP